MPRKVSPRSWKKESPSLKGDNGIAVIWNMGVMEFHKVSQQSLTRLGSLVILERRWWKGNYKELFGKGWGVIRMT
jgi:hypothetical protein